MCSCFIAKEIPQKLVEELTGSFLHKKQDAPLVTQKLAHLCEYEA